MVILVPGGSNHQDQEVCFKGKTALEIIEAIEVTEASEVYEAVKVSEGRKITIEFF